MTRPKGSGVPAKGPGHGGPRRGYSWPPFEAGNLAAAKHGAFSPRVVDPVAGELVQLAVAHVPYLGEPAYSPALWAWARSEARVQLLDAYVAEHGQLDEEGNVRPAAELLRRAEDQASALRARLGLDPLSRAKLGRDVAGQAVDIAALFARAATGASKSRIEVGNGADRTDGQEPDDA